jgi:hypothetical protein
MDVYIYRMTPHLPTSRSCSCQKPFDFDVVLAMKAREGNGFSRQGKVQRMISKAMQPTFGFEGYLKDGRGVANQG